MRRITAQERVAVTIATKNRPAYLAALLGSLVQQTYPRWDLYINDQSDVDIRETPVIRDVLTLLEAQGHAVSVFFSRNAAARYQELLDATPPEIEFIHRIDDDVLLTPAYLENVMRPFHFFPDKSLAAAGGCLGGTASRALSLSSALEQPRWYPRIDKPSWRLQGHFYHERECIEMESLWGCAMCYRRSAVTDAGGWNVPGQSQQIFREDSDMSARLLAAGYELIVTTDARAWHLVAPGGGSRHVSKTAQGNVFDSHRDEYEADERLFRERLNVLMQSYRPRSRARYRIADLENNVQRAMPLQNRRARFKQTLLAQLPRPMYYRLRRARQLLTGR